MLDRYSCRGFTKLCQTRSVWWWWWFFSRLRGIGENVQPFIPHLHLFFFFFKVEISSRTLIALFMPGSVHSGSTSWDDCDRMFPDKYYLLIFLFLFFFLNYLHQLERKQIFPFIVQSFVTAQSHRKKNNQSLLCKTELKEFWLLVILCLGSPCLEHYLPPYIHSLSQFKTALKTFHIS